MPGVEAINEAWGAPGENVDPGERANEDAQLRNEHRKDVCDPLKGEDEEPLVAPD